jgi:hypothetical protein
MNRLGKNLSTGGSSGLLVFFVLGSLILIGLFLSVHSRGIHGMQNELQERWPNVIHVWGKGGYINQGGLWFGRSLSEDSSQDVISPYTMGFLQGLHFLERFHVWLNGSFSYSLLVFHNQLIPMFSSALLGFLAMRLTLRLGIRTVHAFVLGVGTQMMYQTFPSNLWFIWEIYPTTMNVLFMVLFLVCEVVIVDLKEKNMSVKYLRSFSVFSMVYVEWIGALCFLLAYCLMKKIFSQEKQSIKFLLKEIILPFSLAFVVMIGQLIWVKVNYHSVHLMGAGIQPGLNHSYLQVDELARELGKRYDSLLPDWNTLMTSGFLATLIVMTLVRCEKRNFIHFSVLGAGIGFYALFLILGPKSFILPEAYQVYLAFILILALFALLPGWLETFNNNSGIFVLTFFVLAFCWSCIQIRNYAIYYPI